MNESELAALLDRIHGTHVGVVGDFCLDVYWFIDESRSEPSLETALPTKPVREQRCALGAAGNVVHNLTAMGCGDVRTYGVLGVDPWGYETIGLLKQIGAKTEGMLTQDRAWHTLAYVKPYVRDAEQSRLDFGAFNSFSDATADKLLAILTRELSELDVLIVNEQVRQGIHTPYFRARLCDLIRRFPDKRVIVDSRHYSDAYPGACLKINDHEAARLCGIDRPVDALVLKSEAELGAKALHAKMGRPVFVTRGARGCLVADTSGLHEIPAIQVLGQIDAVGAGDSTLAGIAAALAAGRNPVEAATFGTFVATVTIQKLKQTGTATPAEILTVGRAPDFIYRPELAEDPRQARYVTGTEIEIVTELRPEFRITHAIFDHDGTISTLRQGWESVMEAFMIKAVLGPRFDSADESLYHRVVHAVHAFIDKTTGLQTLAQMQSLVAMVREFACVPEPTILDEAGYKRGYNDALMTMVRERVAKLERGELSVEDFAVKNAIPFLRRLHAAGVRLFLASGTDQEDVETEARIMGYAGLFSGGIHGSMGDVTKEAKRIVLDRILNDIGPGAIRRLATFGDGPVEIRETRKRNGFAIGLATDEIRRFGINPAKRARLIRAGADIIIPDFSQMEQVLGFLLP